MNVKVTLNKYEHHHQMHKIKISACKGNRSSMLPQICVILVLWCKKGLINFCPIVSLGTIKPIKHDPNLKKPMHI